MLKDFHKKNKQLLILSLVIVSICVYIISVFVNYKILKNIIHNEISSSRIQDGEFLKISHPIKIGDFAEHPDLPNDPDGGFFVVTVEEHEYLIYKNNLSHRFGLTHYPKCKCSNIKK